MLIVPQGALIKTSDVSQLKDNLLSWPKRLKWADSRTQPCFRIDLALCALQATMACVLSALHRVEQAADGKLNGMEQEPLSTSASEAQRRSADKSAVPLALHEASYLQATADAGQRQDSIYSTQDNLHNGVTQPQGIDMPQQHLQAEVQAMSVVQASPPWALHLYSAYVSNMLVHAC